ncbi:MAG: o-succinylbenzoate--CoA ligase [Liquorilactobacillus ghanensis]|uniref:o-succinylbenzoate--CoA ligase n=1 Tax=Liquorilactobacillus ghanensis TaxID=399370 RepID=UPI0039E766D3
MQNWLLKQAQINPDKTALIFAEQHWTFQQLAEEVLQTAGQIVNVAGKLPEQTRVAVLLKNNAAGYRVILALQQLGWVPLLLNWRLSNAELERQISAGQPQALIVDDSLDSLADQLQLTTTLSPILVSRLAAEKGVSIKPIAEFSADKVASIMYTSGTTGQPHGVKQTFQNHFYSAVGSAFNLGLDPAELWLCALPIFHISGLSIMMRSLIYGMGVLLVPHFSAKTTTQLLQKYPVTLMSVVPQMLQQLLAIYPANGYQRSFRGFLLGGGPIAAATLATCQQKGLPVVQSYGMTETCSQVIALNFADATQHLGSVGKPLFPMQVRLAEQPIGEIQLKGPNLAVGYLDDTAGFLAKMTADGWFKTGDLGRYDQAGFLYICGRQDEMLISGGENVFPQEIENVYQQFPAIKEIAVIGITDRKWGQVPCAFYASQESLTPQQLIDFGRQRLAHYKVPQKFIQLAELPRTASHKISRVKLRELYLRNYSD